MKVSYGPIPAAAAAVGLLWSIVVAWLFDRQRRDILPESTPDAAEREAAAVTLWNAYPAFPDDEPDTALFLLDESRRDYDGWVESNRRIEGKASWLTGFVAGGAGLLTIFGSARGAADHIQPGPFLVLAIAMAFGAVLSCLYILRPKLRPHPSVSAYVSPPTAYVSKARFHLALSLAEEYNRASVTLARTRRFDPVAWTTAQGFLVVAILAILVHFGVNLRDDRPEAIVVNCKAQVAPQRGGIAYQVSCEEPKRAR